MYYTINTLTEAYLADKENRRRRSTVDGYKSSLRLYVLPEFGSKTIDEITPEMIQGWVDKFDQPGAARKAYKCLRQVIRWAIRRYGLRVYDPTTNGVELPRMTMYRPDTLDAKEVVTRLRGFWGHIDEATVLLSSVLGLRPGECYALSWGDINMTTGAVTVNKSRQYIGGMEYVYPTKTPKSDRICYLPRFALRRLRDIWRSLGRPKGLINADKPQTIARRIKEWCRRHNLPHVSMTNLRHTWATLAIEAGVAIETVAMMLGHSNIMTAYDHYIRPRRSICQDAQRQVEALLLSV